MKNASQKAHQIFLVDASSFLYRAYHALRPLHAPDGTPTQAVYGFCRMIHKLINRFSPTHLAIVWDSPGKTKRHQLYPEYKATRQAAPSDLFQQKDLIQEFVSLTQIAQVAAPGVEADDLIAELAHAAKKDGYDVIIVSSDKDLGQLVGDNVVMFDPFKDAFLGKQALEEKYGFPLERLSFYFSLLGDSSDNIPGVEGIGEKTAKTLAAQFSSLDDLYKHLDTVGSERTKKLLLAGKDDAYLSEKLFELHTGHHEIPTVSKLKVPKDLFEHVRPFFERLHFTSLLAELPSPKEAVLSGTFAQTYGYTFEAVTTKEQLEKLCKIIEKKGHVALDTETDGLDPMRAALVGISLCCHKGEAYYIPVDHKTDEVQLAKGIVVEALKPLIESKSVTKVLHNAKFDIHILENSGLELKGLEFDTMVAAGLLRDEGDRIGLKVLSEKYFQQPMRTCKAVLKSHKTFASVPIAEATDYSGADAHQTFMLEDEVKKDLKHERLLDVYQTIEHPLIEVLVAMEREGIEVDPEVLETLGKKIAIEIEHVEKNLRHKAHIKLDDAFNINSPQQVGDLLFKKLGLEPLKKTTGRTGYSTDVRVLRELAKKHEVPELIIKYRELAKLKSTYIDALKDDINPKTGRIHTSYSQTSVATGRLASSDPNLQNIPADHESPFPIRSAFKAPRGCEFISADYSQMELRILAHLSQDEHLKDAFLAGEDIHARTAAGLFDVRLDKVTHDQRKLAKRINFSILYGLTPYGLSQDLDISVSDAKTYIQKYMDHYPGVQKWMDKVIEETKKHGYVTTFWGRRRMVPGIYEQNHALYQLARRVAINTVAQGTAADLMKIGMIKVYKRLQKEMPEVKMVLQIHDELLLTTKTHQAKDAVMLVQETLESVVSWDVPLEANMRTGKTWLEASK